VIAQVLRENVKSLVNESLLLQARCARRAHQVLHNLLNEYFKAGRHGLLTAELSQHLERGGRLSVHIIDAVGLALDFAILLLIEGRAEHENATVGQHVVLEHFGKVE